jgi:1-acyl-sn-glycerol-3-phosphate acyltransferase
MKGLQSALTWVAIVGIVLAALPVLALVRLFDRTPARVRTGRTFRVMGSWATYVNPAWHIRAGGADPAALRHPYVVVSNHQSNADIPVISRLPWEMKWVAKRALFELPVFGWLMRLAGDVPVDRGDAESRASVLRRARAKLDAGCSVMFFAEGTRSKDGRVKRFHDGAFRLAVEAGVPVLPLAIDGTRDALPKHGWKFGRADIRLAVLDPVPTDGLTEADVPALRERVRQRVVETVAGWRGADPRSVDALEDGAAALPSARPDAAPAGRPTVEDGAKSAHEAVRRPPRG